MPNADTPASTTTVNVPNAADPRSPVPNNTSGDNHPVVFGTPPMFDAHQYIEDTSNNAHQSARQQDLVEFRQEGEYTMVQVPNTLSQLSPLLQVDYPWSFNNDGGDEHESITLPPYDESAAFDDDVEMSNKKGGMKRDHSAMKQSAKKVKKENKK